MSSGYIYKIQFPNGKHYIGLTTTSLKQRTKEHKCCAKNGDTKVLYKALRKHDMVDTFELIEIDTADTLEELCEKEIVYIQIYNSHYIDGNGYNMTLGGEGTLGYIYTEEDKIKMSERQKKYYKNPEAIQKNSEALKKYYKHPEAIQKNSEALKKYYEENPEARQKNSDALKKYYEENPEARQQISEGLKKYFEENQEAGKEHGERMKKYYEENPEAREKCSEKMKKHFEENPEAGKEHGERMKKYYEENPEAKRKLLDAKGQNKLFDVFKDGTFIKTFSYQYEAREYLQKEHNITSLIKIGAVLAGNRNSSAGFIFRATRILNAELFNKKIRALPPKRRIN